MTLRYLTMIPVMASIASPVQAQSDNEKLLSLFHKYNITKCDSFIVENSPIEGVKNWSVQISKHGGGIDGPTTEVTLIRLYGSPGDTVKEDVSYIETVNNCYAHKRMTLTYPGRCEDNIDSSSWSVVDKYPKLDYKKYDNGNGVDLFAKDIRIESGYACVQELSLRISGAQY